MSVLAASPPAVAPRIFSRWAWGTLAWNIAVVLWGALVRASGSGAGCGNHWPLCNGTVLPQAPQIQTLIEFTHRLMSGLALIAVAALMFWSFRAFPRAHRVRKLAVASFAFLIAEALLGAGLVLFDYVGANGSAGRALYLSLHLANTLFLLAALALTAWFSRYPDGPLPRPRTLFTTALCLALLVSVSGAIAALGDTLFPATSLSAGFQQDLSASSHFLLRLRVFHPALAIAAGILIGWIAIAALRRNSPPSNRVALVLLIFTFAQLCVGAINLALLAPAAMQILHLLLADLVWISLVLLAVESTELNQSSSFRRDLL